MIAAWTNDRNIDYQILRIGHVYGPGEESYEKVIPTVVMRRLINNENLALYGEGSESRTFIYITDVIRSIINAMELEENIGPVNIVGNEGITVKDLLHLLLKISNKNVLLEQKAIAYTPKSLLFDNTKSRLLLPEELVPLEIGLQREWNHMKQLSE